MTNQYTTGPLTERIRTGAEEVSSGCWEWRKSINPDGYGRLRVNGRTTGAHRASYEAFVGPIPDGLQIDHLCRNRCCVNPAHMELVTSQENTKRGRAISVLNAARTHCKFGHEFEAIKGRRYRMCRTCTRRRKLAYWHRQAAIRRQP